MKRYSSGQRMKNALHHESRIVCAFIYRITLGAWYIPCARCLRLFDLHYLDLDEVDEGRHVNIIPDYCNPGRQQFLCRQCHNHKTDHGHRDYLDKTIPHVRAALLAFQGDVLGRLPALPGQMKHRLDDVARAFLAAKKALYASHPPRWVKGT